MRMHCAESAICKPKRRNGCVARGPSMQVHSPGVVGAEHFTFMGSQAAVRGSGGRRRIDAAAAPAAGAAGRHRGTGGPSVADAFSHPPVVQPWVSAAPRSGAQIAEILSDPPPRTPAPPRHNVTLLEDDYAINHFSFAPGPSGGSHVRSERAKGGRRKFDPPDPTPEFPCHPLRPARRPPAPAPPPKRHGEGRRAPPPSALVTRMGASLRDPEPPPTFGTEMVADRYDRLAFDGPSSQPPSHVPPVSPGRPIPPAAKERAANEPWAPWLVQQAPLELPSRKPAKRV